MQRPDYTLETLHRNAGEIAHFAEHLRKGGLARSFAGGGAVQLLPPSAVSRAPHDQALCGFNGTRVSHNRAVRKQLEREDDYPVPGDRVICLQNCRSYSLYNGTQAVVEAVHPESDTFDLVCDDGLTRYRVPFAFDIFHNPKPDIDFENPYLPFDFAWCVTTHKAQGSEWPGVLVREQHCPYWEPKRWNYTAASRARERLFWVAPHRLVRTREVSRG
jgi:exodeoxyribonuclease-5